MMKKLRSSKGETLIEALVSVLIVALSSVILATMVAVSSDITEKAKANTDELYIKISDVTRKTDAPTEGKITITGTGAQASIIPEEFVVNYYGEENELTAYERKGS